MKQKINIISDTDSISDWLNDSLPNKLLKPSYVVIVEMSGLSHPESSQC